ncbi:MAG: SUMF1/EgtB/PvdO family nonheme iron enzyme [Planctomycetes bacterium]|nr:SUMF1/EgtB/PvdO family nonheme iron enzyme [Planctomycetota bacterium]
MKSLILGFLVAVAAVTATSAQTLHVTPIHVGGAVEFDITAGANSAVVVVCYSGTGSGPFTLANGITLDLSMPIRSVPAITLNPVGTGTVGPFPVPLNAIVGMHVWFQAVQIDMWSSPIATVSNMVDAVVLDSQNNSPIATDDIFTVDHDTTELLDVIANDTDPDGDVIFVSSVGAALNGTTAIVAGQIEYTPVVGYIGSDSFSYTIEDANGAVDSAIVDIDVSDSIPTGMVAIAGGTFEMGDHAGVGYSSEHPVHSVTLDSFYMDEYEVSNQQFADFLNDELLSSNVVISNGAVYQTGGLGQLICVLGNGLLLNGTTIIINAGEEIRPAVDLTWFGAVLYCNWLSAVNGKTTCYDPTTFACDYAADGFRLPTEAEWEYASRGGEYTPYYQFPWSSNSITSGDANYGNNVGSTVDVGSYQANGYGLYDTAGNVSEWCGDYYSPTYYSSSPSVNPTGPATGSYKVVRGGDWISSSNNLRCASRIFTNPSTNYIGIGFRTLAIE